MASATETVYWPLVIALGLGFIILTIMALSEAEKGVTFHTSEQISHTSARSTIVSFLNTESQQPGEGGDPDDGEVMSNYKAISLCYGGIDATYDREAINNPPGILRFTMALATRKGSVPSPDENKECPTNDPDYGGWPSSTTITKGDPPEPWITGGQHTGSKSGSGATGGVNTFRVEIPTGGGDTKPVIFNYEADEGAY